MAVSKPNASAASPRARVAAAMAVLALSCASSVSAHDFWVEPSAFWVQPEAVTPVTLQVGHGPARQRSPIALRRITRFEAMGDAGAVLDQRARLDLGAASKDGESALPTVGAYVVVLQTDDLAQIRFNDYLAAEGLTPALEQRTALHKMDADGSENYSRCAKVIM